MSDDADRPAPTAATTTAAAATPTAPPDPSREWIRGVLEPCLLALVATGDSYGYDLATRLEAGGFGSVPGGSLYPALTRLQKQGLVSSQWRAGDGGPGRKYYRLTPAGRRQLAVNADRWDAFAGTVAGLLRQGVGA